MSLQLLTVWISLVELSTNSNGVHASKVFALQLNKTKIQIKFCERPHRAVLFCRSPFFWTAPIALVLRYNVVKIQSHKVIQI